MPSAVGAGFTWTNKVWPICQLGMSDVRLYDPTTWVDVSCHIHEAELFRGRERFNDRFQPGTATITFANDGGWGDLKPSPAHVAESRLRPGRQIRIGVQGRFEDDPTTVRTRWLWYGYIDQVTPAYDPVAHDVVTISCIDALGEAGSIATPQGPMVGVNETASARINRALNAVEWWPEKRVINASSTIVQGTTLGALAIDVMSVAADSAGGVLFGDMDGRIVFRDLNWELYDPDLPHDGEIGNCTPGTPPIDGDPPYIDPTPGPVYDPCPPIRHPPECVDICAEPGEGTIVEQGDSWSIYMHNHHLFYESAGHVWDMGEWDPEQECVRICHPPPPPPPPPNGPPPPPPPPTTEDPNCPSPPCPKTPGIPAPYPFEVTFLGYTDGGIDDGPQDHITITAIHPGKDALLVVLVNALLDENTGSLTPFPVAGGSIVMGTTVFQEMDIKEPSGFSGAETYGAFIDIGRTDPGTVDIAITWAPDHHSRQHVATAWRVQKARADMKQKMSLGAYLHASTWDRQPDFPQPVPPEPNPPGKGFTRVQQYSADSIGTQLAALTRWTDITIAQSMAESPTPPYGASFSEIDITDAPEQGIWWTPKFSDSPAAPAFLSVASFTDDFQRADGPLGLDWPPTAIPVNPGTPPGAMSIASGDVVIPHNTDGPVAYFTPIEGDHFIELEVGSWKGFGSGVGNPRSAHVDIITCLTDPAGMTTTSTQMWTRWQIAADSTGGMIYGGLGIPSTAQIFIAPAPTFKLRIESTNGGTLHRCFVDDILANEQTTEAIVGGYVGFQVYWNDAFQSPHVLSASVGVPSGCDDFERESMGTNWITGPLYEGQVATPPILFEGHVECAEDVDPPGTALHAQLCLMSGTPAGTDDQSIDVTFANLYQGKSSVSDGQISEGECMLMSRCADDPSTDKSHVLAFIQFLADAGGHTGECFVQLYAIPTTGIADEASVIAGGSIVGFDITDGVNPSFVMRLETTAAGHAKSFMDGALVCEGDYTTMIAGDRVGFGMQWHDTNYVATDPTGESFWIEQACVNEGLEGIVRKCSWVAGYRKSANIDYVDFSEVNFGPGDIQSSQAIAVMESGEDFGFTWKTLNYYVNAPETGGTIPPMSHTVSVRPERTSMVLVYVAVFNASPVTVTVTSDKLTFSNVLWQPQNGIGGWAQGGIWQTKLAGFPIDPAAPPNITVAWGSSIEKIEFIVYEVTNADSIHSQGAIAGGNHTNGSAAGALTMPLSTMPVTSSVCIAFLGVSTPEHDETAGALIGAGWYEEIEVNPTDTGAFFQVETRTGAADATVTWADVDESDTGRDAIALAVEVVPSYNFLQWSSTDPLMIGGSRDGYSRPIYSVVGHDEDGTPVWGLHPGAFALATGEP
jgi:hypothetical protein